MSAAIEILTADESDALDVCEQRIAAGFESFRDVGNALKAIRDGRLYRATHSTFADYCSEKWNFTHRRGNQIILATVTVELLPDDLGTIVPTESAARELARVEPEHREDVVRKAAEAGPVTANAIKQAAADVAPEPEEPQEPEPAEDSQARAYRVSLKIKSMTDAAKDIVSSLNPTRAEIIQAAMALKRLGNELERAAAQLPE